MAYYKSKPVTTKLVDAVSYEGKYLGTAEVPNTSSISRQKESARSRLNIRQPDFILMEYPYYEAGSK